MSFKVWIARDFDNTHENEMVADAIRTIRDVYVKLEEPCHVLVNFKIPGDPPMEGEKPYMSEIDLAVLKSKSLVIVDLKNYIGPLDYGDQCAWICHAANGDIEVHGGKEGRTPFGQISDYNRQMSRLLQTNQFQFLNNRRGQTFEFKKFVKGIVLFPDIVNKSDDVEHFVYGRPRWFSVARMCNLVEQISGACAGRDSVLSEYEIEKLVNDVLKLHPAHLVGNIPKLGAALEPVRTVTTIKTVTIEKPVEVRVEVPKIVRDEFGAIVMLYDSDDPNPKKVLELSDTLRRLVSRERKRRFKETEVRSLGTALEILLKDDVDLTRCAAHLSHLCAAINRDKKMVVSQQQVDESFKTVCRIAEKFCGEPMPLELQKRCARISYGQWADLAAVSAEQSLKAFFLEVKSVDHEKRTFVGIARDDEARTECVVRLPDPDFGIKPNMVVCAVTPFIDGDVWKASEIVLEPDYLISPQSIGRASVFGNTGLYFWLNAISDDVKSGERVAGTDGITLDGHILLGNYANACLAEYAANGDRDATALAKDFCRKNALDYTKANPAKTWFAEGKCEAENISRMLTKVLPDEHNIRDRVWQVEAPLYSPQYGLSARADAISYSADRKSAVVVELKSGKWDSFKGDRPREEHVCQPSFYADILGFSAAMRRENVMPFLYYGKTIPESRYNARKDGKLFLRPSVRNMHPGQLIRHYSSLRNEILLIDAKVRNGELRPVVDNASVDSFRSPACEENGRIWQEYKRPEIESLLAPFQKASDIEKRYFYRTLQFIAEESFVARVGDSGSEIGRGGISMGWRLGVRDRQETGLRLSELERLPQEGDVDSLNRIVRLSFDTTRNQFNSGCSIRQGDGVGLYLDNPESNITNSIVFAATVEKLEPGRVVLKFDDPQPVALFGFGPTARFAVEAVPMSGQKEYKSLWHFLTGDAGRRKLVLNEEKPSVVSDRMPPIAVTDMERRYSGVSAWLGSAWRAKDWYLIWGPPGTGKTSHAMRALVDEAMATQGAKILLLAYTYKATDKICEMLEARISSGTGESYLRIGRPEKCDAAFRSRIPEEIDLPNRNEVKKLLDSTRIFVSTVSTLGPRHSICGLIKHFDLAIVDEASQLLDIHMLPLFCAKRQDNVQGPLVDKFVFIGDDRQLPAVVQQSEKTSRVDDDELNKLGIVDCRESFFSRLKRIAGDNRDFCGMLDTQFRMHPMIADFCNQYFYDGRLKNGNSPRQLVELPPIPPTATPFEQYVLRTRLGYFPVDGGPRRGGKVSIEEARMCIDIIKTLLNGENRPNDKTLGGAPLRYEAKDFGVIVPFRNQIACLREAIGKELGAEAANAIAVDTVERNQGGERRVVIFSTVITAADQAEWISAKTYDDEAPASIDRKLNVAITRAQERFYLVGCERVLSGLRAYGELLRWISDHAGYCEYDSEEVF